MSIRSFKKGDLVCLVRVGDWTLTLPKQGVDKKVRETSLKDLRLSGLINDWSHPRDYYSAKYDNIEGKVGLIVYVSRNRLDQPVGYRVLIEGNEVFCKAKVADKYFKLVEQQDNEGGGSSAI